MNELNAKQKRFCQLYLAGKHSNAECVRLAGYSPAGASAVANRMLKTVNIQKYLDKLRSLAAPPQPEPIEIEVSRDYAARLAEEKQAEQTAIADSRQCMEKLTRLLEASQAMQEELDVLAGIVRDSTAEPGDRAFAAKTLIQGRANLMKVERVAAVDLLRHQERLAGDKKDDGIKFSDVLEGLGNIFKATPERD